MEKGQKTWNQVNETDEAWQLWRYERACYEAGQTLVCGVDEAGAGPLAGAVYAAAVILPPYLCIEGLNDSKKLSAKKREQLFVEIQKNALAYAISYVEPEVVDEINILNARLLCMQKAVKSLSIVPQYILIDGNRSPALSIPHQTIVKGDGNSASIAAASILAKVSRDRYMEEMELKYPGYGFAKHKGYGTKLHYERLRELGPSALHRRSFLKNL